MADNNNMIPELLEQAISEQNRIRLEKLQGLVEAGKDPYVLTKFDRTHLSTEVLENYAELGSLYASMNHLTFVGDRKNVDMNLKYAELGKAVCEMSGGFFVGDKFYGRRKNN